MTAVVGILCSDGVVVGTDSSTTFFAGEHFKTIEQPCEKIYIVADRNIISGTGEVGLCQRFCSQVEKAWRENVFRGQPVDVCRELSHRMVGDFQYTSAPKGHFGALLAFACEKKLCLCEFDIQNFQPELKTDQIWYCSIGSAQPITDPFLGLMREVFWKAGPPKVSDGVFAATWALEHAIKVNPGGVNGPIRIAVLERDPQAGIRAHILREDVLEQHRQNVEEAKAHLAEYPNKHRATGAPSIPAPPKT